MMKNTYFAYFAYFGYVNYLIISYIKRCILKSYLLRLTSPYFALLRLTSLKQIKTGLTSLIEYLKLLVLKWLYFAK